MKATRPGIPPILLAGDQRDQPSDVALFQTPPTSEVNWREELARVSVVAGVAGGLGIFGMITAAIVWPTWTTVAIGGWFTALLFILPFAVHAIQIAVDIQERHRLDRARMNAEHQALVGALDADQSGTVDDAEVEAFMRYVRALRHGAPTTASHAQAKHGISGPAWQGYRKWLIAKGYAVPVARRGGEGFVLKPSVRRAPWPKLEARLRQQLLVGLAEDGEGTRISDGGPIDAVSTLGRD